jgi:hypothetical protein
MLELETRTRATRLLDAGHPAALRGIAWAERVLREQEMPSDELRVVLTSVDRALVRRHLDLHLERLDEWIVSQQRRVELVGLILSERRDEQETQQADRPGSKRNAG